MPWHRFGFVVYKTREAAANAVEHLNGKNIPDLTGPAAERKVRWPCQPWQKELCSFVDLGSSC